MKMLENRTYDELNVGDSVRVDHLVKERDLILFAEVSGDVNPVHLDEAFAANTLQGPYRPRYVFRCAHIGNHRLRAAWPGHYLYRPGNELSAPGTPGRHHQHRAGSARKAAEKPGQNRYPRVQPGRQKGG